MGLVARGAGGRRRGGKWAARAAACLLAPRLASGPHGLLPAFSLHAWAVSWL